MGDGSRPVGGDRRERAAGIAGMVVALVVVLVAALLAPAPASAQAGDDAVTAHGDARFLGSTSGLPLNAPLVGAAATPEGQGYWLLGGDGGVFAFGEARFHGSTGGLRLNAPVVDIAADARGRGYWTAAADGGVFSFGVPFHGSMGGRDLNARVVAIAASPTGHGYWLVGADGGVFTFGDARFHGSTGGRDLDQPIVDIAAHPEGRGYWLLAADGAVHAFDVPHHGAPSLDVNEGERAVGITAHPGGGGYLIATNRGAVHARGSATAHGGRADTGAIETIDVITTPTGGGYWLVHAPTPRPQVISTFTTPLQPGQHRNVNIHLAADYIDGTVIQPGQSFSLNRGIGERTRERGFISNGFIDEDGDIGSAIGGGISQLGTTFLNAAWFSGIQIDEFRQHTIYFPRYPMCREATLSWGFLDVVVTNDSPYEVIVDTAHTSSSVTVSFLSRPWAEVSTWTSEPFDVAGAGGAFSVRCGRTATYPDGSRSSEAFFWRYRQGYPG